METNNSLSPLEAALLELPILVATAEDAKVAYQTARSALEKAKSNIKALKGVASATATTNPYGDSGQTIGRPRIKDRSQLALSTQVLYNQMEKRVAQASVKKETELEAHKRIHDPLDIPIYNKLQDYLNDSATLTEHPDAINKKFNSLLLNLNARFQQVDGNLQYGKGNPKLTATPTWREDWLEYRKQLEATKDYFEKLLANLMLSIGVVKQQPEDKILEGNILIAQSKDKNNYYLLQVAQVERQSGAKLAYEEHCGYMHNSGGIESQIKQAKALVDSWQYKVDNDAPDEFNDLLNERQRDAAVAFMDYVNDTAIEYKTYFAALKERAAIGAATQATQVTSTTVATTSTTATRRPWER